jgi:hypothetical protein
VTGATEVVEVEEDDEFVAVVSAELVRVVGCEEVGDMVRVVERDMTVVELRKYDSGTQPY